MEILKDLFIIIKKFFEFSGVIIITVGSLHAIYNYIIDFVNKKSALTRFSKFKASLSQSIILGLELTVVADIISMAIDQTYHSLGILFILVVIRTLISYFLDKDLRSIA